MQVFDLPEDLLVPRFVTCGECDFRCRTAGQLRKHEKYVSHHQGIPLYKSFSSCPQCDFIPKHHGALEQHQKELCHFGDPSEFDLSRIDEQVSCTKERRNVSSTKENSKSSLIKSIGDINSGKLIREESRLLSGELLGSPDEDPSFPSEDVAELQQQTLQQGSSANLPMETSQSENVSKPSKSSLLCVDELQTVSVKQGIVHMVYNTPGHTLKDLDGVGAPNRRVSGLEESTPNKTSPRNYKVVSTNDIPRAKHRGRPPKAPGQSVSVSKGSTDGAKTTEQLVPTNSSVSVSSVPSSSASNPSPKAKRRVRPPKVSLPFSDIHTKSKKRKKQCKRTPAVSKKASIENSLLRSYEESRWMHNILPKHILPKHKRCAKILEDDTPGFIEELDIIPDPPLSDNMSNLSPQSGPQGSHTKVLKPKHCPKVLEEDAPGDIGKLNIIPDPDPPSIDNDGSSKTTVTDFQPGPGSTTSPPLHPPVNIPNMQQLFPICNTPLDVQPQRPANCDSVKDVASKCTSAKEGKLFQFPSLAQSKRKPCTKVLGDDAPGFIEELNIIPGHPPSDNSSSRATLTNLSSQPASGTNISPTHHNGPNMQQLFPICNTPLDLQPQRFLFNTQPNTQPQPLIFKVSGMILSAEMSGQFQCIFGNGPLNSAITTNMEVPPGAFLPPGAILVPAPHVPMQVSSTGELLNHQLGDVIHVNPSVTNCPISSNNTDASSCVYPIGPAPIGPAHIGPAPIQTQTDVSTLPTNNGATPLNVPESDISIVHLPDEDTISDLISNDITSYQAVQLRSSSHPTEHPEEQSNPDGVKVETCCGCNSEIKDEPMDVGTAKSPRITPTPSFDETSKRHSDSLGSEIIIRDADTGGAGSGLKKEWGEVETMVRSLQQMVKDTNSLANEVIKRVGDIRSKYSLGE